MRVYNFQKLLEACSMIDEELTVEKANMAFYVCGKMDSDTIHDFASVAKMQEKKEHEERITALHLQRKQEVAEASAALKLAIKSLAEEKAGVVSEEGVLLAGDDAGMDENELLRENQAEVLRAWESQKKQAAEEKKRAKRYANLGLPPPGAAVTRTDMLTVATEVATDDGWPTPVLQEVQILESIELASLAIPMHNTGDPTHQQQKTIDLELAELPGENGSWSGLVRSQLGRLHLSPLSLSIARQLLAKGLLRPAAAAVQALFSPFSCSLPSQSHSRLNSEQDLVTKLSELMVSKVQKGQKNGAQAPMLSKMGICLGPAGPPPPPLCGGAEAEAEGPSVVAVAEGARSATQLLASLDDIVLARSFRLPHWQKQNLPSPPPPALPTAKRRSTNDHQSSGNNGSLRRSSGLENVDKGSKKRTSGLENVDRGSKKRSSGLENVDKGSGGRRSFGQVKKPRVKQVSQVQKMMSVGRHRGNPELHDELLKMFPSQKEAKEPGAVKDEEPGAVKDDSAPPSPTRQSPPPGSAPQLPKMMRQPSMKSSSSLKRSPSMLKKQSSMTRFSPQPDLLGPSLEPNQDPDAPASITRQPSYQRSLSILKKQSSMSRFNPDPNEDIPRSSSMMRKQPSMTRFSPEPDSYAHDSLADMDLSDISFSRGVVEGRAFDMDDQEDFDEGGEEGSYYDEGSEEGSSYYSGSAYGSEDSFEWGVPRGEITPSPPVDDMFGRWRRTSGSTDEESLQEEEAGTVATSPRTKQGLAITDSINRLTTTKESLEDNRGLRYPSPTELFNTTMDRKQFGECVRRLASEFFPLLSIIPVQN